MSDQLGVVNPKPKKYGKDIWHPPAKQVRHACTNFFALASLRSLLQLIVRSVQCAAVCCVFRCPAPPYSTRALGLAPVPTVTRVLVRVLGTFSTTGSCPLGRCRVWREAFELGPHFESVVDIGAHMLKPCGVDTLSFLFLAVTKRKDRGH